MSDSDNHSIWDWLQYRGSSLASGTFSSTSESHHPSTTAATLALECLSQWTTSPLRSSTLSQPLSNDTLSFEATNSVPDLTQFPVRATSTALLPPPQLDHPQPSAKRILPLDEQSSLKVPKPTTSTVPSPILKRSTVVGSPRTTAHVYFKDSVLAPSKPQAVSPTRPAPSLSRMDGRSTLSFPPKPLIHSHSNGLVTKRNNNTLTKVQNTRNIIMLQAIVRGFLQRRRFKLILERNRAALVIQALWRGFKCRSSDPVCASIRRELRTRRLEDHLIAVSTDLDLCQQQLRQEMEVRRLQHEAIGILWSQVKALQEDAQRSESRNRNKAARILQKHWRAFRTRQITKLKTGHAITQLSFASSDQDNLWTLCLAMSRQIAELKVCMEQVLNRERIIDNARETE